MSKPRIAIAIGDPAGIGPEIVFKAANSLAVQRVCRPIIFGGLCFFQKDKNFAGICLLILLRLQTLKK